MDMAVGDSVDLTNFAYNSATPADMKVATPSAVPGGDAGSGSLDAALQISNGTSLELEPVSGRRLPVIHLDVQIGCARRNDHHAGVKTGMNDGVARQSLRPEFKVGA